MSKWLLVFLLALGSINLVQAEDVDIAQQIKEIQSDQDYAKKEADLLKSALQEQIKTIHQAQENKIEKVRQDVSYKQRLLDLWVVAIGAVVGFFAGIYWKTRDLNEIIEKEVAKHREKTVHELSSSLEEKLEHNTQKIKDGLNFAIEESARRIQDEKESNILVLTTNGNDSGLFDLFISHGFPAGHIIPKDLMEVFPAGEDVPNDTAYDLVVLDSFEQETARKYIEAGKQPAYLLYIEGMYDPKKPMPDRNRSIMANSKPTVYGHAMTLFNFNRRKVVPQ